MCVIKHTPSLILTLCYCLCRVYVFVFHSSALKHFVNHPNLPVFVFVLFLSKRQKQLDKVSRGAILRKKKGIDRTFDRLYRPQGTHRTCVSTCVCICVFCAPFFTRWDCVWTFFERHYKGFEGKAMVEKRKGQSPLVCHGHSRPIVDIFYSPVTPDGYFLVSASKDGKPMLRNGETGDWIGTFEGHKGAVWSACLNPPATLAATASADFSARVWDALTGNQMHEFQHKHIVRTVTFSADSKKMITGGMEKTIRIYDLAKPEVEPVVLPKQESSIRCAVWSKSNENLLYSSCSDACSISVWDLRTKEIVQEWKTSSIVTSIELSSADTVTSACGREVVFWKAETGEMIRKHDMPFVIESATLCPEKVSLHSILVFDYEEPL